MTGEQEPKFIFEARGWRAAVAVFGLWCLPYVMGFLSGVWWVVARG